MAAARLSGAERRERILTTSLRLFASRGFAATRTRDVAEAAGVSEAMVFKLFPDKESLYRAILERRIAEMERIMPLASIGASGEPPADFLRGIAETALRRIEDDPSFLRLMLFSALEGHTLAADYHRARAAGARAAIAGYLRRQARAGVLRCADPDFAARAFMGMVLSWAISRTVVPDAESRGIPRAKLVGALVDLYLEGMLPRGVRRRA